MILSNWYRLCCRRQVPRSSPGMLVATIDKSRLTPMINLRLRVVNLRCSDSATRGRACLGGALVYACGRWFESRQALRVAFVALQVVGPHPQYRRCCDCHRCLRNGFRYWSQHAGPGAPVSRPASPHQDRRSVPGLVE